MSLCLSVCRLYSALELCGIIQRRWSEPADGDDLSKCRQVCMTLCHAITRHCLSTSINEIHGRVPVKIDLMWFQGKRSVWILAIGHHCGCAHACNISVSNRFFLQILRRFLIHRPITARRQPTSVLCVSAPSYLTLMVLSGRKTFFVIWWPHNSSWSVPENLAKFQRGKPQRL